MNSNGFFIKKIMINNFRGYAQQEFTFFEEINERTPFILIAGPNGYGKSSLLDAIEWCLTGNIRRLEEDYQTRKETAKNMQKCLIRHNGDSRDVIVRIDAIYLNNPLKLERKFSSEKESDCFNPLKSRFIVNDKTVNGNPTLDSIFNQSISKSFYERYTCSYEKNIRVYEKSRDDIYEMFSSFFGGTKEIEAIIDNLEGFIEGSGKKGKKVKGIIEELSDSIEKDYEITMNNSKEKYEESEKKLSEIIKNKQKYGELLRIITKYPNVKLYYGELTPSELLNEEYNFQEKIDKIQNQRKILEDIKFLKDKYHVYNDSQNLINHLKNKRRLIEFNNEVLIPYNRIKDMVRDVQGKNVSEIKEKKEEYLFIIRQIELERLPSKKGAEKLLNLGKKLLEEDDLNIKEVRKIFEKFSEFESINSELKAYDSTDPALKALRTLIDHSEGFNKIRANGQKECPLCGSEEFYPNKKIELIKTARNLLGEIDKKRQVLQSSADGLKLEIEDIFYKFKKYLIETINHFINGLNKTLIQFDTTNEFKKSLLLFGINFDEVSEEKLREFGLYLENNTMDNTTLSKLETDILNVLKNENDELFGITKRKKVNTPMQKNEFINLEINEKIESLTQFINAYKAKQVVAEDIDIPLVNLNILELKLNVLKGIENGLQNDYLIEEAKKESQKHYNTFISHEKKYKKKIMELDNLKEILNKLKIQRNQWDKSIIDDIKLPLQKIYRRINRHTNIDDINLLMEGIKNPKLKLVANINNKEISASNILSAGQLSVVALAIFLTVAMGQKRQPFKCYFMDDPIQTMDDLNILSFIDLLRVELSLINSSDISFVDQLFFTTCDENLEKLISHKMKSFRINHKHIRFNSFGKYEVK